MEGFETIHDFYFTLPACIGILGSSSSGKGYFLRRFLTRLDEVTNSYLPVSKLVICFDTHQEIYDDIIEHLKKQFPGLEVLTFQNYPEEEIQNESFFKVKPGTMGILIFDDLSEQIKPSFEKIFRKLSHHQNWTVFYLSQDSSSEPNVVKKALRSVTYLILMRSSMPGIFLADLNRKFLPGCRHFLHDCFNQICKFKSPFYPYLILDTKSYNNKVRTGIFKEEIGRIFRY